MPVKFSTLGRDRSAYKVVIRKEGTLDGMAAEVWAEMLPRAKAGVLKARSLVHNRIDDSLSRVGTGPAIAGEPPRYLTGELKRALGFIRLSVRKWSVRSGIQIDHEGANRLEYGKTDKRGIQTFPHPYVRPAFESLRGQLDKVFEDV